ncbi:MAG: membrane dipeptidase [Firmicutes bacterium]|nr:membrane dipeptidase [Bacillota bacterium]HOB34462.1 dipeptidase [Bacillota bacterium]HPZ90070.1 dipeptidase [Bacillota bacterium]HQE01016.1 dipeptidase [Bacillota bacterium]
MALVKFADFHCDTLLNIHSRGLDFAAGNNFGHLDLPRLKEINCVFQCFAVFCDPKFGQEAALRRALRLLNVAKEKIFSLPDVVWVKSGADIDAALQQGKLAGLLSIEGADFLGDDLFLLDLVYSLGVRLITLTWNGRNTIADGIMVGDNAGGLTAFGVRAVRKMQELNIIVDVSHLAERGFWDVSKIAVKPFVASHSNAWEICPHPRNLKDDQIREIARHKGLIGMNLCPSFVAESRKDQTLTTLVKHISHIASVAGPEVICLGCDWDGITRLPEGMNDVRDILEIADILARAGFSAKEIGAICSDNLLNFLRENLGQDAI